MAKFMLKRLGQTLLIVVLVSFLTLLPVSFMPKDPVYSLYGTDLTQAEYEARFIEMGLDKPVLVRYLNWAKDVLRGDFGISYRYHESVLKLIGEVPSVLERPKGCPFCERCQFATERCRTEVPKGNAD